MTSSNTQHDEGHAHMILQKVIAKDESAFAEFYHLFESRLYRFIQTKTNDPFEAADILNEVFLDVWKQADRFKAQSKISTWLFSIAHHKTIDKLRKKRPEPITDEQLSELTDDSPDTLTDMISNQQSKEVHHCIATLTPPHRAVMELTFFEDMSYKDIAIIVDCPENTVKTRMFHAKQAMKRCLTRLLKVHAS
jgi:RNA polymerase sigma-70 factor (ECF subfamily)